MSSGPPRPMLSADVVALAGPGPDAVLLVQRGSPPFAGAWALPGGFVEEREPTRDAAAREFAEETGLSAGGLRLLGVYDAADRDPRGWTVSVAYLTGLEREQEVTGGDDAADARWFKLDALPPLAFDHAAIVADALTETAGRSSLAPAPPV